MKLILLTSILISFIVFITAQLADVTKFSRVAYVDIDSLVDITDLDTENTNLDNAVEHVVKQGANTVFIQAYRDGEGYTRVEKMYFPNTALGDYQNGNLFVRLANRFKAKGIKVGAWMPVLAWKIDTINGKSAEYILNWDENNNKIVQEDCTKASFYCSLTPFNIDNYNWVLSIYKDLLKAYPELYIINFHDDAAMNFRQDYSSSALAAYAAAGFPNTAQGIAAMNFDSDEVLQWSLFKSNKISTFVGNIMTELKKTLPGLKSSRNFYTNVFYRPSNNENKNSVRWFGQDCTSALQTVDYLSPMVFPYFENQTPRTQFGNDQFKWFFDDVLTDLKKCDPTLKRFQICLQAVDWKSELPNGDYKPISEDEFQAWVNAAYNNGASHIGYYPSSHYGTPTPITTNGKLKLLLQTDLTLNCSNDIQCESDKPICNIETKICQDNNDDCTIDIDCNDDTKFCNENKKCQIKPVNCSTDVDCVETQMCNLDTNKCINRLVSCLTHSDCTQLDMLCDLIRKVCVETDDSKICTDNDECSKNETCQPREEFGLNMCVEKNNSIGLYFVNSSVMFIVLGIVFGIFM
jgi:hypothetical protein